MQEMTTQMLNECTTSIPSKYKLNVMEVKKNYGRDMKIANYCRSSKTTRRNKRINVLFLK
jgi:hypothetical protein